MNRRGLACMLVTAFAAAAIALFSLPASAARPPRAADTRTADPVDYRAMVEADWAAQEQRLGRTPGSPEATQAALRHAARLLEDLRTPAGAADLSSDAAAIDGLRKEADRLVLRSEEASLLSASPCVAGFAEQGRRVAPGGMPTPLLARQGGQAVGMLSAGAKACPANGVLGMPPP